MNDFYKECLDREYTEEEYDRIEGYCRDRIEAEVDADTLDRLCQRALAYGEVADGVQELIKDRIFQVMLILYDPDDLDLIGQYRPREQLVQRGIFWVESIYP